MNAPEYRVLIIKPSSLGDVLHAFPAVSLLKKEMPEARIDWLITPLFSDVLDYHPAVNERLAFNRKELGKISSFPKAFSSLVKEIRSRRYDLVIDMQGLMRSAFFAWTARTKKVVGFASPREPLAKIFYNTKIEIPNKPMHAVDKNILLVSELLKCSPELQIEPLPVVKKHSDSLNLKLAEAGIKTEDKCIGIIPGARWESKCWPPEFFSEIIRKCSEKRPGLKFLIIGSPADCQASDKILEFCPEEIRKSIVPLAGKTSIGELVEVIRRCSAAITNDSGPMHIAAALKVPLSALFGPTDPLKTGPYGSEDSVFQADLSCIKCLKRYCQIESYDCHSAISSEKVSQKMMEDMDNHEK